jgi:hypothetical protein
MSEHEANCAREILRQADDSAAYLSERCTCGTAVPAVAPLRERLEQLVAQWRARADGIIDDVNHGKAPTHEADRSHGWQDCADELEAALASPGAKE